MSLLFLGTGANGGVPQWETGTEENVYITTQRPELWRDMSAIAVSTSLDDHYKKVLIDCPPLLERQLHKARLTPQKFKPELADLGYRECRIDSVFVTHGHYDHIHGIGMFSTGKSFEIPLYGSDDLITFTFGTEQNPGYFAQLGRLSKNFMIPHKINAGEQVRTLDGALNVTAFEVQHTKRIGEDKNFPTSTYAYRIEFEPTGAWVVYAPDIKELPPYVLRIVEGSDAFILDGTFWWNDELARTTNGKVMNTSYELGHLPMEDSLEILKDVDVKRVIFTHFNQSNPMNIPGRNADVWNKFNGYNEEYNDKFAIAYDLMEIVL